MTAERLELRGRGSEDEAVPSAVLLVATSPASLVRVGGLPLVVRAALTLRSAGFTEIAVWGGAQEGIVRAVLAHLASLRITWVAADRPLDRPGPCGRVLVLSGDVLFDADAVTALDRDTRLQAPTVAAVRTSDGQCRVLVCPAAAVPSLVAGLGPEAAPLPEAARRLGALDHGVVPSNRGLFVPLDGAHPPAVLTRLLLDHLGLRTAATDGYLTALLDRRVSRLITRAVLGRPGVTPNRVTVASILVGLLGAVGLVSVSYWTRLGGTVALLVSSVVDGVDGELARARFEQSAFGARLDLAGDYAVHLATFLGLGIGLVREGVTAGSAWAALALVAGVAAAIPLVHALVLRSERRTAVTRIIERVAGRDYTYLLFLAALAGHPEWFVHAAAAGSWIFVAGLLGYWAHSTIRSGPDDPSAAERADLI